VWEDRPATLNFVRDITVQKNAEEELRDSVDKLRKITGATIQAMAQTVEVRDPYTAGHQKRVADLARAIATRMGLSSDRVDGIRMAGAIHDIGKISVPAEILSKPGLLTPLEFSLIKTHAQIGYDILKDIEFPWDIATMVLQHHERLDGSGYPQGVTGERILLEARILTVADVVEAMASHRPYRPSLGMDKALEEIKDKRGRFYDPDVVDACLRLFSENKFTFK
jgi:putative nucleotidyltransferase with HDIG domain